MSQKPIKMRLLEYMSDGIERWSNEIIEVACREYGISMDNAVSRDYVNFDLIELAANGFLKDVDEKIDTEGTYKKDALLHKYVITGTGKSRAEAFGRQ